MENTSKTPANIEVITEYREGTAIVGAKIFISTEDAKVILRDTAIAHTAPKESENMFANAGPSQSKPNMTRIEEDKLDMLYHSRDLLRQFARAVLYSPVVSDTTLASIASKYL